MLWVSIAGKQRPSVQQVAAEKVTPRRSISQHRKSWRCGFRKGKGDRLTQRLVPIVDISNQSSSPLMIVRTSYFEHVHASESESRSGYIYDALEHPQGLGIDHIHMSLPKHAM